MPLRYAETRNIVFLKRALPVQWCLHEHTCVLALINPAALPALAAAFFFVIYLLAGVYIIEEESER